MDAPQCIGIILDGNRRWATEHGLPKLEGHRRGADKLMDSTRWVRDRHIGNLVVYLFSTENWKRDEEEVSYLMDLFRDFIRKNFDELGKEGVRVRFVGQRERFSKDIQELMDSVEKDTAHNTDITLWACLSYGSRAEIADAAARASAFGETISEETIANHLWTAGMPDPDIIIRTSGQKRLSNFLLWQAAYSELFFLDSYWPDFSEQQLDQVLSEFATRARKFGT